MKKSLESLIFVLISFISLSCSKGYASDVFGYVRGMFAHTESYEIYWHDLRDSKLFLMKKKIDGVICVPEKTVLV